MFYKVGVYKTNAGTVPAFVLVGYDSGGDETTTEGDVVTADILVGYRDKTYLTGVTKGSSVGQFAFGS